MDNQMEIGRYRYTRLTNYNGDYFSVGDNLLEFNGLLSFFNVSYIKIFAEPYDAVTVRVIDIDSVVLAEIFVDSDQSVTYSVEDDFHFLTIT
jgi:hypothetical protein